MHFVHLLLGWSNHGSYARGMQHARDRGHMCTKVKVKKGKVIPLQARCDPEGG